MEFDGKVRPSRSCEGWGGGCHGVLICGWSRGGCGCCGCTGCCCGSRVFTIGWAIGGVHADFSDWVGVAAKTKWLRCVGTVPFRGRTRVWSLIVTFLTAFVNGWARDGIVGVDGIGDEDVKDADTRVSGFVKLGSNHSSIEVIATAFSHLDVDTLRIMLGAILEHRVMDGDRFGAKDVIRRSNGFWDLEVPSSTLHDELIGCIVASWHWGGRVPAMVGINQAQLIDLVPFQLELVNARKIATGVGHIVHHGSMMGGHPVRPLQVDNISGLDLDGMLSWCSVFVADDISVRVGWWTDVSIVVVIGDPAWRDPLRLSPRVRNEVFNAKDRDWAMEEGLSRKHLLFAIDSVTHNVTMCNDLWGKTDSSQPESFERNHIEQDSCPFLLCV